MNQKSSSGYMETYMQTSDKKDKRSQNPFKMNELM